MSQAPPPGPDALQTALCAVARAIADSLDLKAVFERVADACRAVVPFEAMGVSRLEPENRVRVYVTAGDPAARALEEIVFAETDFSPELRHASEGRVVLVRDAEREMDAAFAVDRRLLERGYRSLLRLPLVRDTRMLGSFVLVSRRVGAFAEDHARTLAVVADLVTL